MGNRSSLSVMMFLQYAIWGAWLPILYPYLSDHLKFTGGQIGNIFAVGAVGAILAPLIAGQIADRHFATQKFLGWSHLLGAVLVWQLGSIDTYASFLAFSLVYSLIYSPTLALTNSLAFHHLGDTDDFGKVRVWGTLGWIAAGIGVAQWLYFQHGNSSATDLNEGRAVAFQVSAILGMCLGIYCFLFLPHTPPSREEKENAFFRALEAVLSSRALFVLFLVSIPISCIHQFYFVHTAGFLTQYQQGSGVAEFLTRIFGAGGGGIMTIGQVTELAVVGLIPLCVKRVSRRTFLLVGTVAYAMRMALFAYVDVIPMSPILTLALGVALHGVCFGCFIFVAFMIVDELCAKDVKASAQSLYNFVIIGIGIIVGSKIAAWVGTWAQGDAEKLDYADPAHTEALFSVPLYMALACFLLLVVFYPNSRPKEGDTS